MKKRFANKKSSGFVCQSSQRKALRKAKRKFIKVNNAIHYAEVQKTKKVCLSKDDLEIVKSSGLLSNDSTIQKSLKGKVFTNKCTTVHNIGLAKKSNKKKKKKKANINLNKVNNPIKEDETSSLSFSNSNNSRMAKFQDYVNEEANKINSESEDKNTKKTVIKEKYSDDRDLLNICLKRDEDEIKRCKKELGNTKKIKIEGLENIESLLDDIDNGNMNSANMYNSDSDEDFFETGADTETSEQNEGKEDNSEIENSEQSDNSIEEEEDDAEGHQNMFLDDEASEGSNEEEQDETIGSDEDEHAVMFEGGLGSTTSISSIASRPTSNSVFNLYEREEESEDDDNGSDLENFIVPDSEEIEYETDSSEEKKKTKKKLKKRKRICMMTESSENDSPEKQVIDRGARLRIESTDDDEIMNKKKCKRVRFSLPLDDAEETIPPVPKSKRFKESQEIKEEKQYHEDIYGRMVDDEGNIMKETKIIDSSSSSSTYVPPHIRKLKELKISGEKKEKLEFLQRKIKGLLNRLSEGNLQYICNQIEDYYLKYSHNDVSQTLTNLLIEAIALPTLTAEKSNRRIQEHALMVSILSTNVGSEVGAHILTEFVLRFVDCLENLETEEESKEIDNLLLFTCYIYSFKVVGVNLIHDIIYKLLETFETKHIELLLSILSSVGFCLREDNALKLKEIIEKVQKKSKEKVTTQSDENFTRIRFMLDILTNIKHNNMKKVPNYDPEVTKHFQSLLKSTIKNGRRSSPLNVSLNDLIKSKTMGKWWVVGSAWSSEMAENPTKLNENRPRKQEYDDKFLKKATKLRLSRVPRINILFALTEGADGPENAADLILQLNLNPNQEDDIFNVLLICNNKNKFFNEAFSKVAIRLIQHRKKYKKLLQNCLWNTFSDFNNLKKNEMSNLSHFTVNLIASGTLDLFVFKNFEFVDLSQMERKFLRLSFKNLFSHSSGKAAVEGPFRKLANSPKLDLLLNCLKIFIQQYLFPKNPEGDKTKKLLEKRAQLAVNILNSNSGVKL